MGSSASKETEFKWIDKYQLIDVNNNDKILKLMSKVSQQQYIGKQYFSYSQHQTRQLSKFINKKLLNPCPYLMQLVKVGVKSGENYCGKPTIFYLVFENPFQTLKEETIQRKIKNIPYSQIELDLLLQSCIKALYYLDKISSYHQAISSNSIFIKQDRTIVLGDPWLNKHFTKEGYTQMKMINSKIYHSPQKILFNNQFISHYDKTLSDIFTLGIVLLQIIYFQNMDCLYQSNFRRILDSQIIEKISYIKYPNLKNKLKIILSHEPYRRRQIFKIYRCKQFIDKFFQQTAQLIKVNQEFHDSSKQSEVKTVKKRGNSVNKSIDGSIIYKIYDTKQVQKKIASNNHNIQQKPQIQLYPHYNQNINISRQNCIKIIHPTNNNNISIKNHYRQSNKSVHPMSIQGPHVVKQNLKVNPSPHDEHLKINSFQINPPQDLTKQVKRQIKSKQFLTSNQNQLSQIRQNSAHESCQDIFFNMKMINQQLQHNKKDQKLTIPLVQQKKQSQITQQQERQMNNLKQQFNFSIQKQLQYSSKYDNKLDKLYKVDDSAQSYALQNDGGVKGQSKINRSMKRYKKYRNSYDTIKQMNQQSPSREQIDKSGQHFIIDKIEERYRGGLKDGKREGFGMFTYENGFIYKGEWKENQRYGKGKLQRQNGSLVYDGSWYMDCFHGHGVLYNQKPIEFVQPYDYQNLSQISSLWQNYQGQFLNNVREGKGKLKLTNGQIYIGQFKNNKINGDGKYYKIDGKIIMGIWKNNKLISEK